MKTKDYSIFKFSKSNRGLSEQNVLKLMYSIREYGFIEGRQVLVNPEFVIIDGQHRLEAAKRLGIDVPYQIIEGDTMKQTIALNAAQIQWKLSDYIISYSNQGVDCYRKLVKFEDKYKLGFTVAVDVFLQNSVRSTDSIKKGEDFKINERADEIAEFILACNTVPYFRSKAFARAIVYLFKRSSKKQLDLIKLNILSIPQQPKLQGYLTCFENILNHKKRGDNRISL